MESELSCNQIKTGFSAVVLEYGSAGASINAAVKKKQKKRKVAGSHLTGTFLFLSFRNIKKAGKKPIKTHSSQYRKFIGSNQKCMQV